MHRTPTETLRLDKREAGDLAQAGFLDRLFEELAKLPGNLTELRNSQLRRYLRSVLHRIRIYLLPITAVIISQVMHQVSESLPDSSAMNTSPTVICGFPITRLSAFSRISLISREEAKVEARSFNKCQVGIAACQGSIPVG